MTVGLTGWVFFHLFVFAMLALDLGVLNRKPHAISFREALFWSILWVVVALLFNAGIYWYTDPIVLESGRRVDPGTEFLAGYLIERALSVDNIFVFVMIFSYFRVDPKYQHRVLFWGILTALVLRGLMIGGGIALIERFHWLVYVFGLFLIFTGIKMGLHKEDELDVGETLVVRLARRFIPMTDGWRGKEFFVREAGRVLATPLLVVLLVVETSDVIFALDSIPAILAVTQDPFIVYTSNVFAILGLRALYFLLAEMMDMFRYLKAALSLILVFVGVKMMLAGTRYEIPLTWALGAIVAVLAIATAASVWAARRERRLAAPDENQDSL